MVLGCLDDIAKVRRGKRERGVSDLSPIFVALIFGVVSGHSLERRAEKDQICNNIDKRKMFRYLKLIRFLEIKNIFIDIMYLLK
jgi:hypothetical protein